MECTWRYSIERSKRHYFAQVTLVCSTDPGGLASAQAAYERALIFIRAQDEIRSECAAVRLLPEVENTDGKKIVLTVYLAHQDATRRCNHE